MGTRGWIAGSIGDWIDTESINWIDQRYSDGHEQSHLFSPYDCDHFVDLVPFQDNSSARWCSRGLKRQVQPPGFQSEAKMSTMVVSPTGLSTF